MRVEILQELRESNSIAFTIAEQLNLILHFDAAEHSEMLVKLLPLNGVVLSTDSVLC
jgi:hypothetical protein